MSFERKLTLSFEMMPPRAAEAEPRFWECANELIKTRPDFLSITYGAAGTDRTKSLEVMKELVLNTPILPIAHLTCIATRLEDLEATAKEFLEVGVRMFLALRGDVPNGVNLEDFPPSKVESSAELTNFIRLLDKQRQRENANAKFRSIVRPIVICVAALLEGNPILKTSVEEEVDKLLKKQDAGADFAITQLYYDPKVYDSFVNKARKAGVTIPILAGILPAVTVDRLVRCEKNLGVKVPVELIQKLEQADEADKEKVALDFWENLAKEAVNSGSPGIHMFTFNQSKPSLLLARRLGLTND